MMEPVLYTPLSDPLGGEVITSPFGVWTQRDVDDYASKQTQYQPLLDVYAQKGLTASEPWKREFFLVNIVLQMDASGQMQYRQKVWRYGKHGMVFSELEHTVEQEHQKGNLQFHNNF